MVFIISPHIYSIENRLAFKNKYEFFELERLITTGIYQYIEIDKAEGCGEGKIESLLCVNENLLDIYSVISDNEDLFNKMALFLYKLYGSGFSSTKRTSAEQGFVILDNIVLDIKKCISYKNIEQCLCELLSFWFLLAFAGQQNKNITVAEGDLWFSRHEILNTVTTYLRNFVLQYNIIIGRNLKVGTGIREVIFYILHQFEEIKVVKFLTKNIKKNKREKFVALLGYRSIKYKPTSLMLLNYPWRYYIHKGKPIYLSKHYALIRNVVHNNKQSINGLKIISFKYLNKLLKLKLYVNFTLLRQVLDLILNYNNIEPTISQEKLDEYIAYMLKNKEDAEVKAVLPKLYEIKNLLYFLETASLWESGVYLPYYFDFRGRVYSDSPVGFTHSKVFRYLYYYGFYTSQELKVFYKKIAGLDLTLVGLILRKTNVKQVYEDINYTCIISKFYVLTVFFELGKIYKNNFIADYNGAVSAEEFVIKGIDYYSEPFSKKFKFDDNLARLQCLDILAWLNKGMFIKAPIFKDATASALQILMLLLKSNKQECYDVCNLTNSFKWFDTYYFLIQQFYKDYNISLLLQQKYFTRSNLKKTIMTYNYEATYLTCWKDFLVNIGGVAETNTVLYTELETCFKLFFRFLENLFTTNKFFAAPSIEILKNFKNIYKSGPFWWTTPDDFIIPLDYYKVIRVRLDRCILKRETIVWNDLSEELDQKKMFRALRANIIHGIDSLIVRTINLKLKYPIITVHDSFGIDILSLPIFEEIAILEYQNLFDQNLFGVKTDYKNITICSPFIFL